FRTAASPPLVTTPLPRGQSRSPRSAHGSTAPSSPRTSWLYSGADLGHLGRPLVVLGGEHHRLPRVGSAVHQVVTFIAESSTAGCSVTSGRSTLNVVPTPALLLNEIVPPCASTIVFAIESPRPVP